MTYSEFAEKFNIKLNEQQCRAVQETDGAVLLLAVPGSGKTTVLVARLGYMIFCKGIDPRSVLTMTYTVAATNDMRKRFCSYFGNEMQSMLEFRTINGVCSKIIRTYEQLGSGSAFDVLSNEKDVSALLSAVYREVTSTFPTESDIKSVRTMITYAKNMMLSDDEIKSLDCDIPEFYNIYRKYCGALRERRLMDYDDQMVYACRILKRYPQILERIHDRYRYICVDEAQDTSKIQHEIIALLAQGSGNLFMVGDEDQSIYGFRAAYPQALTNFEKNYRDAKVLLMEENFRSGANIVNAADRFISRNTDRHKKLMRASRTDSDTVKKVPLADRFSQYKYLLKAAKECRSDTAILYRDNESAIPLIDLFERNGVPYRIRSGDMTFFTHRTVQDIRNIIRFAYDPYDTDAFIQIYYKISTYLNKANATAVCDICRRDGLSVWNALFALDSLSPGAMRGCRSIKENMDSLTRERADKAVSRIFNTMGYCDYLDRMGMKYDKMSILAAIGANELTPQGLLRRLDELEKLIRSGFVPDEYNVTLSTIHSSKGLEYDTVYLIDVYDGMFPETAIGNPKYYDDETVRLYQEERRLFYVAVTRAKNTLCLLTYADEESSFCDELLGAKGFSPQEISDEFIKRCEVGRQINHKQFGAGTVISKNGDIITVSFAEASTKKLSIQTLFSQKLLDSIENK